MIYIYIMIVHGKHLRQPCANLAPSLCFAGFPCVTPHNELVKSYKSVGCVPPRLKFLFRTFDRLSYVETCVFPFLRHHSSGELREGSLSTRTLCQDKWQSLWLANKLIPCWELTYPIQRQLGRWNSCSQLGYASFLEGNACKLSNVISDFLSKHKLPHCSAHKTGSHSQQSQKDLDRIGVTKSYSLWLMVL